MASYCYRMVNVFSLENQVFSGNPSCVFEDATGLSDEAMQALALVASCMCLPRPRRSA
jgi:predicted PhzF superfamily epimerase YddE/YHI9